jgi:hypothetical protein
VVRAGEEGPVSAKSVRKGKIWERAVARELTESTGVKHARSLDEAREGNRGDVRSSMPFVYQAKCGARPDVYGALAEAKAATDVGEIGVAAIHRTGRGGEKLAVLSWDDWVEVVTMLAETL